ncbi:MAG: MarR family transcriptional regulator [Flavobacteriaceae bacterium]|nr:MarR family transcriptional regulator [Bacteroidia bacterium]MBT8289077.1 MarR family transcriptional regulator [Bacteroidia bacterium]NNF74978.1 MarR family transcriptional regulator [Flavobacteriaceae bacterium]NNK71720.1 MarR family transcriptional regulator [Flavobacteriaceae bacterium]
MTIEEVLKIGSPMAPSKKTVVHMMYTGDYVLKRINSLLKPYDLTSQQYNVLRILRGQRGQAVPLSRIQERMINKNSNTTRLIDKLVNKNYVSRKIDSENRRKLKIGITKEGLKLLYKIDPLVDRLENKTTEKLSLNEMNILNTLLEKIRH